MTMLLAKYYIIVKDLLSSVVTRNKKNSYPYTGHQLLGRFRSHRRTHWGHSCPYPSESSTRSWVSSEVVPLFIIITDR